MNKKIKSDIQDFTEQHYRKILKVAKEHYKFIFYDSKTITKPHIILRHDIDASVHRALKIAKIENEYGIKSTFFLRIHSEFYNLFEKDITEKIYEIIKLKHKIGLHFEKEFYPKIKNQPELETTLLKEKKLLENVFNYKINAFAFHNPTFCNMLRFDQKRLGTMLNAYGKKIKADYRYCSDSDGYWRHDRIFDVIQSKKYDRLHILTHPEWWHTKPMTPKERIKRAIECRAKNQLNSYKNMLKNAGRHDVG